jgi:hypothetical protein
MTTATTPRHETATRFLAALAGNAGRGELNQEEVNALLAA